MQRLVASFSYIKINFTVLLCIMLLAACLSSMVGSLTASVWVYQVRDNSTVTMNLFKCNNCPMFADNWSWTCFARWYCEFNSEMSTCIFYDEGSKANRAYIALEVSALIAGLLLLEKLLAFQFYRDYGSPASLYAFAMLMTSFHLLATLYWFGVTGANFSSDCTVHSTSQESAVPFCASTGPILALIALGLSLLTMIVFFFVFYSRKCDRIKVGAETGEFLLLSTRTWMWIVGGLLLLAACLICLSVYIQSWVERDSDEVSFKGGLIECVNCHYRYQNLGWDCLTGFMCEADSKLGYCKMYDNLRDAGRIVRAKQYMALCTTSMAFITLWSQGVIFILQGREYGFASLNYVSAIQIYASCAFLFQLLAVCLWFGFTGASFSSDCSGDIENSKDVLTLCSTLGPIAAIGAMVTIGLATLCFCVAFYFRGQSYMKEMALRFTSLNSSQIELKDNSSPRSQQGN